MTLEIPKFIEKSGIMNAPVTHEWDNSNPIDAFYSEDSRLGKRIEGTSWRGVIALTAGFAEWVAWRLNNYVSDTILLQRIEAVWASIIDWRYMRSVKSLKEEEWNGNIRGPIWAAANLLKDTVEIIKKKQFAWPESVYLSNLALHVIPDQNLFKEWRRFAIKRLSNVYPQKNEDILGVPIAREVLDPEFDYRPEMSEKLLGTFLERLNPKENPYLSPPDEMIEKGFEGKPYRI